MTDETNNKAYFKIYNFTCSFGVISEILQLKADKHWHKGEQMVVNDKKVGAIRKHNTWEVISKLHPERAIEEHVQEIIELLTPKAQKLWTIYTNYGASAELTIVSYMYGNPNPGFWLDRALVEKIGKLGASLDIDIYNLSR